MPKRISELTSGGTILSTDEVVVNRGGASFRVTGVAADSWANDWVEVVKAVDESVTNTTLQGDDSITFSAASGKSYQIEVVVIYASPAGAGTPDIKMVFGEDTTARGVISGMGQTTTDVATLGTALQNGTSNFAFGTAATDRVIYFFGHYVGAGGTWRMQWAQQTSNANPVIVRAGSLLRYRQLN